MSGCRGAGVSVWKEGRCCPLASEASKQKNEQDEFDRIDNLCFCCYIPEAAAPFPISFLDAMPCYISPSTRSATAMTI